MNTYTLLYNYCQITESDTIVGLDHFNLDGAGGSDKNPVR